MGGKGWEGSEGLGDVYVVGSVRARGRVCGCVCVCACVCVCVCVWLGGAYNSEILVRSSGSKCCMKYAM